MTVSPEPSALAEALSGYVGALLVESGMAVPPRATLTSLLDTVLWQEELAPAENVGTETEGHRLLSARLERSLAEALLVVSDRVGSPPPATPSVRIEATTGDVGTGQDAPPGDQDDVAELEPGVSLNALVENLIQADQRVLSGFGARAPNSSQVLLESSGQRLALAATTAPEERVRLDRELVELDLLLAQAGGQGVEPFEPDLVGTLLGGKYRLIACVGRGGFGTVYRAVDEILGARVAVKVLNPRAAGSKSALENFLREAKLLTSLDHENIVRWISFDRTEDGLHYFVMEYLDGAELEAVLRREGALPARRVAPILLQILAALRRAHDPREPGRPREQEGEEEGGVASSPGGLLHLDLKPENVFLMPPTEPGGEEHVKVIDFGIAQHVGAEARAAEGVLRSVLDLPPSVLAKSITAALPEEDASDSVQAAGSKRSAPPQRARGGTLLYASPEQAAHLAGDRSIRPLDGRSDLYSLGVMAFRMLTGEFPWSDCRTALQVLRNHLERPPRRVRTLAPRTPRALVRFVERCLAKDPDNRWRDTNEAYEALQRIVRPRLSARSMALVGVASMALVATVAWSLQPTERIHHALWDGDEPLTRIHLGPGRAQRELTLPDEWTRADRRGMRRQPRVVAARGDAALAGWGARWIDVEAGRFELFVEPGAQPADAQAAVLVETAQAVWVLGPVTLEHLGPWSISELAIEGRDSEQRAVEPRGATVRVRIEGARDALNALRSLELGCGDLVLTRRERFSRPDADGAISITDLPLDRLGGRFGREQLWVRAVDAAGQMSERDIALVLANPAVQVTEAGFGSFTPALQPGEVVPSDPGRAVVVGSGWLSVTLSGAGTLSVLLSSDAVSAGERDDKRLLTRVGFSAAEPTRRFSLRELGLTGASERVGTLWLEAVDDALRPNFADPMPLRFRYLPANPELIVRASVALNDTTDEGASSVTLDALRPELFGQARTLEVRIHARERFLSALSAEPQLLRVDARGMRLADVEHFAFEGGGDGSIWRFPIDAPGSYRLLVRTFDVDGGRRGREIGAPQSYALVFDPQPPSLVLSATGFDPRQPVSVLEDPAMTGLVITARDALGVTALPWSLQHEGLELESGDLAQSFGAQALLDPSQTHNVAWPLKASLADGHYVFEVRARDAAGNVAQASTLEWEVACRGPRLRLDAPRRTSGQWELALGRWDLRVQVEDVNRVDEVVASLQLNGTLVRRIPLVPSGSDTMYVPAPNARLRSERTWSRRALTLRIEAVDGHGNTTLLSETADMPDVVRYDDVLVRTGTGEEMLFVAGNRGFEYVFGRRAGFSGGPWSVRIEAGGVPDYYLDTREVTAHEFRSFVEASNGYVREAWWPRGSAPTVERREELSTSLGAIESASRSVTGVSWPEASAYAAWREKRLPSLVEWEYAARRASTGHEGLLEGVREWSETPQFFFPTQDDPELHYGLFSPLLLDTPSRIFHPGDVDGDRQDDLLALGRAPEHQLHLFGTEGAGSHRRLSFVPAPEDLEARDVNHDGRIDLVLLGVDGLIRTALQNVSGGFEAAFVRGDRLENRTIADPDSFGAWRERRMVSGARTPGARADRTWERSGVSAFHADVGFRCALDADKVRRRVERGDYEGVR